MLRDKAEIVVVGAGIVGIATAYYLAKSHAISDILIVDQGQPMAFTSAQSGENYRNWWPHPTMVSFTNRSIDLLEEISRGSDNRINMNRRGYALATRRREIDDLMQQLADGLGTEAQRLVRVHEKADPASYVPPLSPNWTTAPDGVDVLHNRDLIRATFPGFAEDIQSVVHIRRGGDISGQQLGMHMLEFLREHGARRVTAEVMAIDRGDSFTLDVRNPEGRGQITAGRIVNAAGPFAGKIAAMLGETLPIYNTFQQKIAFEDSARAIPRDMPFSIDLDDQIIDWTDEERGMLREDTQYSWLAETMPGAIHCRPDGGDNGRWLKLGWAYNETAAEPTWEPPLDPQFPEIVLRGAARLNPSLKHYYGQLPRGMHHYGGWYTMTEENWPLIGRMATEGAYMNCALSGFGTMAACAAGELCAAWVAEGDLPGYAASFSIERRQDAGLMAQLNEMNKGVL